MPCLTFSSALPWPFAHPFTTALPCCLLLLLLLLLLCVLHHVLARTCTHLHASAVPLNLRKCPSPRFLLIAEDSPPPPPLPPPLPPPPHTPKKKHPATVLSLHLHLPSTQIRNPHQLNLNHVQTCASINYLHATYSNTPRGPSSPSSPKPQPFLPSSTTPTLRPASSRIYLYCQCPALSSSPTSFTSHHAGTLPHNSDRFPCTSLTAGPAPDYV